MPIMTWNNRDKNDKFNHTNSNDNDVDEDDEDDNNALVGSPTSLYLLGSFELTNFLSLSFLPKISVLLNILLPLFHCSCSQHTRTWA